MYIFTYLQIFDKKLLGTMFGGFGKKLVHLKNIYLCSSRSRGGHKDQKMSLHLPLNHGIINRMPLFWKSWFFLYSPPPPIGNFQLLFNPSLKKYSNILVGYNKFQQQFINFSIPCNFKDYVERLGLWGSYIILNLSAIMIWLYSSLICSKV